MTLMALVVEPGRTRYRPSRGPERIHEILAIAGNRCRTRLTQPSAAAFNIQA
jgi:hypothetical protein